MNDRELFDQDPDIVSGALVFRGTRVPVEVLFENLADGVSLDEILDNYPSIGRERAEASIRLAASKLVPKAA